MPPRYGTFASQEQNISTGSSASFSTQLTAGSSNADTSGKSKSTHTTADGPSGPARKPILAQAPESTKRAHSDEDDDIIFVASYNQKSLKQSDVPSNGQPSTQYVPIVPSRSTESLRTPFDQPAAQVSAVPAKGCSKIANNVDLSQKMPSDDDIVLIEVVASVFDVAVDRVVTQDTFNRLKQKNAVKAPYNGSDRKVSIDKVHGTEAESRKPTSSLSNARRIPAVQALLVEVFVKTFTGKTISCFVDLNDTVEQLKFQVAIAEGIPVDEQSLIFSGKALEDDLLLSYYGIKEASTGHLTIRGLCEMWTSIIKSDFLDPAYNYDYTYNAPDTEQFMRGKEVYERPIGWKRIAVNVGSKYRDNLGWLGISLGPDGPRKFSVPDEWPVSYHGTKKEHANDIAGEGLQLAKCTRFAFGKGIYSTPSLKVAETYAQEFIHNGIVMKVIFQNRVNPKTLKKVPKTLTGGIGEYWISPTSSDIRPYGICYKMVR